MATITIDDVQYELDDLSDEAKAQLESLQAVEVRIARANEEIAILQTARNAYAVALKEVLPERQ